MSEVERREEVEDGIVEEMKKKEPNSSNSSQEKDSQPKELPLIEERVEEILLNNHLPLLVLDKENEKEKERKIVNRKNLSNWLSNLSEEKLAPYFSKQFDRGRKVCLVRPFSTEVIGLTDYETAREGGFPSEEAEEQYWKALALSSLLSPYGREFGNWLRLSDFGAVVNEKLRELLHLPESERERLKEEIEKLEKEAEAVRRILERREKLLLQFKERMKEIRGKFNQMFEFPEEVKELQRNPNEKALKRLEEIEERLKSAYYKEVVESGLKKGRSFEEDFPAVFSLLSSSKDEIVVKTAKSLWERVYAPLVRKLLDEGEGFATSILSSLFVQELALKLWLKERGIERNETFLKIPSVPSNDLEKVAEFLRNEENLNHTATLLGYQIRELFYPTFVPRNHFEDIPSKLFNLEVILSRIFEGKMPKISKEEINALLGGNEKELSEALEVLREGVSPKREVEEKIFPLTSSDYISLLKEVGTIRFVGKVLKEETPLTERIAQRLRETEKGGLFKRALVGGLLAYAHSFSPSRSAFLTCAKRASLPPDKEFNQRVSTRFLECLDKFVSEIERRGNAWLSKAQEIASPSPINPFRVPFAIFYSYLAVLRSMQGAYWSSNKVKFIRELSEKGREVISLPAEEADRKLKELSYEVVGISATVKEESSLNSFEARGIASTTEEARKILELEGEEFLKALLSSSLYDLLSEEMKEKLEGFDFQGQNLNALVKELKEEIREKEGKTYITLLSKSGKAIVFEVNEKRVKELGGEDRLRELFATKDTEKFLSFFGLSQDLILRGMEEGKIRNGMEFNQVWKFISLSTSYFASEKEKEGEKAREFLPEI